MPRENPALLAFNRGIVDTRALARIDLSRIAFSAEEQKNWMPRALGSMTLRPGLEYIGSTRSELEAVTIPFIFAQNDLAQLELTNIRLRIWVDEAVIARPSVSTTVTNGEFTSNITGWTDADESGASSTWNSGGFMALEGTDFAFARRRQQVTVAAPDQNVEHALRVEVSRGSIVFRVGTTAGDDDYIEETTLEEGTHSLAFTPTGDFHIEIANATQYAALVDSCTVESAGNVEIPTPITEADLEKVRWVQSGNVVFIAADGYQQRKIERRGTRSWSVAKYLTEDGPFRSINVGTTTLTPSALNGDITLTASQDYFRSGHDGALFRLTSIGQEVEASFTGAAQFSDDIRVSGVGNARTFDITRSGTWTATITLQRSVGEPGSWSDITTYTTNGTVAYNDGLDNQIVYYRLGIKSGDYTSGTADVDLDYANGGLTGVAKVVNVNSGTSADAIVLSSLGGTDATELWSEGGWSDYRGWPTAVELYEGRLWWFGQDRFWGSISDAFYSFDDDEEGDSAPIIRSIGFGPVDKIRWAVGVQRLLAGTDGAEISARSTSFDEPLTPSNFNIKSASTQGSANIAAVRVDTQAMFVQAAKRRLYMLAYSFDANDYVADDLTKLVPDLNGAGIKRLAVQRQPDTRIHCIREDGLVSVLIFDRLEDVACWVEVETDGTVEDCHVLPGTDEDAVYYTVKRTINGVTRRYIEKWAKETECIGGTLNKQADSFATFTNSPASRIVGSLNHLEGETVVAWADGKCLEDANGDIATFTVANNEITLTDGGEPYEASTGVVGLAYTARYKSTKLAYAAGLGSPLLQRKRVSQVGVLMENAHHKGLLYGPDFTTMDDLPQERGGAIVDNGTVYPVYDEDMFSFPGEWDTDSRVCLKANAPRPVTLDALVMSIATHDKA